MNKLLRHIILFLAVLLSACDDKTRNKNDGPNTRFSIQVGDKTVQVRITCTEKERQRGLMHVKSMPENEGMLFLARKPEKHGFWMKNTLIPLDIGYFCSDGLLREVHPMYPRNLDSVHSLRDDIRYALEMNQGWFQQNGITPGARLGLDSVADAIRRRGYSPNLWIE